MTTDLETPDEAFDLADGVVRTLKELGVDARGEVRRVFVGQVAKEIISVAEETDATVIVMGTRGLSDWQGLILGSVAHKVVHMTDRPVLLIR